MAKETVREDLDKVVNYNTKRNRYYCERQLRRLLEVAPENKNAMTLDFGGTFDFVGRDVL